MDTQPITIMEWYKKILKYSNRITATIAFKDELGDYIAIKVYIYI